MRDKPIIFLAMVVTFALSALCGWARADKEQGLLGVVKQKPHIDEKKNLTVTLMNRLTDQPTGNWLFI